MFLIIGVWGGPRRVYAAFKFFLYTLTGSVLMLLALLAMWFQAGTTDIAVLLHTQFPPAMQFWLFLAFLASFAVKVPMWPVHTWLPDAHVEAPTAGSVILAGVLLKMGAYGFLRFSVPMLPQASRAVRAADVRAVGRRGDLHVAGRAGADRHEEADRLFVGRAYGRGDDRHLHLQRAGHPGRDVPDAVARHRLGGAVPRASAWSTTACTRARSPATAASPTGCRPTRWCSCCSPWRASACPARPASSASSWCSSARCKVNFWLALLGGMGMILGAAYMLYLYRRVIFGRHHARRPAGHPRPVAARDRGVRAAGGADAVDGRLSVELHPLLRRERAARWSSSTRRRWPRRSEGGDAARDRRGAR